MNCREFVDFLMEYMEGDLGDEEQVAFLTHMDLCPPCVTYLETYRQTVGLEKDLCRDPDGPLPEDVPEELVRAILAVRSR